MILKASEAALELCFQNRKVWWDKEKKIFLLIYFFQQRLISTYYAPEIMLIARDVIMNKMQVVPSRRTF